MSHALVSRMTIQQIVEARDAAIVKMADAVNTLVLGYQQAQHAEELAKLAHKGMGFYLNGRAEQEAYTNLFRSFDAQASFEVYRQQCDAKIWMWLYEVTGLYKLMDKTAKDELYKDLCGEVPLVTAENAYKKFQQLTAEAELMFQRGLARAFIGLDRRFRSHDGFKLGARIILTNVFNSYGGWNYHSRMEEVLADIERVFAVLDQADPDPNGLRQAINADRSSWGAQQSVTETRYFRIKGFMNGNAHIWFKRDDLVEKANLILAAYYGEVIPDATPHPDKVQPEDLKSTELSTNLQFYPTPVEVIRFALRDASLDGATVLEPSAGTGNMVRWMLDNTKVKHIRAIEVDPVRSAQIPQGPRSAVSCANFLVEHPSPVFDYVVMNPPFYHTHWMSHVVHGFEFVKPGGTLIAILPVSAELGETKKHIAFRKWAKGHKHPWRNMFSDLPPESFAESGTRINTVVLILHKPKPRRV